MKRLLWFPIFLIILCSCSGLNHCKGSGSSEPDLQILFIGNSYTFVNDLPGEFARLACSGGHKIETEMVAIGGWKLEDHAASPQTIAALEQDKWDYVVLQEQSEIPAVESIRTEVMYPAVRQLNRKISARGAQPILFLTWGHRDGSSNTGASSYKEMQVQLVTGYLVIAKELKIPIAPVGYAWYEVMKLPNPVDLWQADGSHPNIKGTYLAVCVFYSVIFHQSPEGLSYPKGVNWEEAQTLQRIASETVNKYQW